MRAGSRGRAGLCDCATGRITFGFFPPSGVGRAERRAIPGKFDAIGGQDSVPFWFRREKLRKRPRITPRAVSPNTQEVGFSVEISLLAAGEFFRASAVPDLEAILEAQKKSA
jgi:hypothetical protein